MSRTSRAHFAQRSLAVTALALSVSAGAVTVPAVSTHSTDVAVGSFTGPAASGLVAVRDTVRVAPARAFATRGSMNVPVGHRFQLGGTVRAVGRQRPVRLLERTGDGTRVVAHKLTTRRGRFVFVVSAGSTARVRTFAAYAPRATGLKAHHTPWVTVNVYKPSAASTTGSGVPVPPSVTVDGPYDAPIMPASYEPAPAGSASDWAYLFNDGAARWDPCKVITWRYNPTGSYSGSLADVKHAFGLISGRTGLKFRYLGTTTYVQTDMMTSFPDADIAVGWSDPKHVPDLAGAVVGIGGGQASPVSGKDVPNQMTNGYAVFDKTATLPHGYTASGKPTWGQVMMHEIMHSLGMGHAHGTDEVMAPDVSPYNHRFGRGDLTGMAQVGTTHGCL